MSNLEQNYSNCETSDTAQKLVDRPRFRPDIEGLRAIAILLVLAYHAKVPGFAGGYIGVDIFFVLSGYLITWLLIYEAQETGSINLVRFYSRRARRLLPAMLLVLIVTIAISSLIYAPFEQLALAKSALGTSLYLGNAYFALTAVDYLGAAPETNPLLHTWSLSVEEQFYFVWPVLVMFALGVLQRKKHTQLLGSQPANHNESAVPPTFSRTKTIVCIAGLTAASFLLSLYLTETRQAWAFFLSPARAWEFSIGAITILTPIRPPQQPENERSSAAQALRTRKFYRGAIATFNSEVFGWMGFIGLAFSLLRLNETTPFPGLWALLPSISTICILRTCQANAGSWIAKGLSWRVFQNIGRVSYAWYLWHWPILVFASAVHPEVSIATRVGLMIVAWALAEVSYRWLENPIRHSSLLARRPSRSIALGIFITVLSLCLSFGWLQNAQAQASLPNQIQYTRAKDDVPVIYSNGCHVDFFAKGPQLQGCTVTTTPSSIATVILVGDSHAAQWYAPLAKLAESRGWAFTSMTKFACPYVDIPKFEPQLGREYAECSVWQQKTLEAIQTMNPDLVVVTSWDEQPFKEAEWIEGTDRMMQALSQTSKHVVAIRDTPSLSFDAPTCLARKAGWFFSTFSSTPCEVAPKNPAEQSAQMAYDALKLSAKRYANVSVIDMNNHVCNRTSCELQTDDLVLYRDEHHLTKTFSLTLTQPLYRQINQAIQNQLLDREAFSL